MDLDFDTFDSDVVGNRARVGKFQPKAKPKPKSKPQPENKSSSLLSAQSVEAVTISNNDVIGRTDQEQSQKTQSPSAININADFQSSLSESEGKNADIYLGLDSFNDSLPQSTIATESGPVYPDLGMNVNASTHSESPAREDPLVGEGAAIFCSEGDFHIEKITTGTEDTENFPCLETVDITSESIISSGLPIGKFQPKPNTQNNGGAQTAFFLNPDAKESASNHEDIQTIPLHTEYTGPGSIPASPTIDDLDLSSIRVDDYIPTDKVSDYHVIEEATDFAETYQSDANIPKQHTETVPQMALRGCKNTKSGKGEVCQESGISPEQQKASTPVKETQSRTSRRAKKQSATFQLVDESEDDSLDGEYVLENDENNNIDEYDMDHESLNEKKRCRTKKPSADKEKPIAEKEKPTRKRKKAKEVAAESTKVKPKKFPHRTRRTRRRVNPDLLKIPEDEIDFGTLPFKDMILLAEYRERMARNEVTASKNEATTSGPPTFNESASGFSAYNEEDAFTSMQDSGFGDDENNIELDDSTYYNYRTHMKITARARWSKQDTELFYEAIQQFGTDLSMIKECFPGLTREQIKSKFKKEERQNPLRLHEALTIRAKDHSHFEVLIERLKKNAAQGQDHDVDGPTNLNGEEEEVAADMHKDAEAAKSEQSEKEAQDMQTDDVQTDDPVVKTPEKSDDSDDDELRWSQYKSEI